MIFQVQVFCFSSQQKQAAEASRTVMGHNPLPVRTGPARWVGERVHSRATLVEELECLLTTLEIPRLAWELPSPFSRLWAHWPGTQGGVEAEPSQWGRYSACLAWHFLALVCFFFNL